MRAVQLAHQGGWDEALLVLVPIAAVATLLWLATRRARAIHAARSETSGSSDAGSTTAADHPGPERLE